MARIDVGGTHERRLLAICSPERLRRILRRVFDETEFLSPHGVRMLSRYHLDHPYVLDVNGQEFRCDYEPAESTSGLFGGNSNWRGPVWMPLNYLLIESLQKFHYYLGDAFTVELPTGSGRHLTLWECSLELQRRLVAIFRRDAVGRAPVQRRRNPLLNGPALARPDPLLRILSRRHRGGARRLAPDRLDRARREDDRSARRVRRPASPEGRRGLRGNSAHVSRYDLAVIGSGQGGVPLALDFAQRGKRVVLFERGELGGCCVNVGCTPSKAFLASAHAAGTRAPRCRRARRTARSFSTCAR